MCSILLGGFILGSVIGWCFHRQQDQSSILDESRKDLLPRDSLATYASYNSRRLLGGEKTQSFSEGVVLPRGRRRSSLPEGIGGKDSPRNGSTTQLYHLDDGKEIPPLSSLARVDNLTPRSQQRHSSLSIDTIDRSPQDVEQNDVELPLLLREGSLLSISPNQVEIGQRFAAGGSGQCLHGRFAGVDVVLKELYTQIMDNHSFDDFLNEAGTLNL